MLLAFCITALLCALGAWIVAKSAFSIARALGTDLPTMLLWLGLAEEPLAHRRSDRRRLGELHLSPTTR